MSGIGVPFVKSPQPKTWTETRLQCCSLGCRTPPPPPFQTKKGSWFARGSRSVVEHWKKTSIGRFATINNQSIPLFMLMFTLSLLEFQKSSRSVAQSFLFRSMELVERPTHMTPCMVFQKGSDQFLRNAALVLTTKLPFMLQIV